MPAEHLILNMLIVLFIQGFANSASRHAVVLGWMISITSTNICIARIRGQLYFWVNAEYLMLMCVSYEFERHTLRHFVKVKMFSDFYFSYLCILFLLFFSIVICHELSSSFLMISFCPFDPPSLASQTIFHFSLSRSLSDSLISSALLISSFLT